MPVDRRLSGVLPIYLTPNAPISADSVQELTFNAHFPPFPRSKMVDELTLNEPK